MDVDLLLKAAGIGMIVTVVCQIMSKAGKDEQSSMVSIAGMVVILLLVVDKLGSMVSSIRQIFGL